ncbi:LamG-like jellyroll fold domain-containing protein [Streptosporangium sp. NPDC002524]|uniref:LamG-like jellyroll fold domain-containing protein n=1 Tax=Streptosporangium sp. NPDC002524 TaxID=3154537 RepID=UPI0033309736
MVAVLALAASFLVPGGAVAQVAPARTAAPSAPAPTPFPRPDDPDAPLRAAVAEARKQNKPVEATGAFTETSRTWAFPDGSLRTESYSGPAQVKRQDGSWAWIDTTLVEKDGVLKPRAAKADLAFSLGGDGVPFAVMRRDAKRSLSLSWEGKLPRPVVEGNVATYPDAAGPAADLVVTALPTGFRHDVVLRERPTGPLEIRIPVESSDLTLEKSGQGGLELTDARDRVVAQAPKPVMWDSTGAGARDTKTTAARRSAPIATSVVEDGGKRTLVLKPDAGWLADPATVFPVVVDPTSTLTVKTDTLLSSGADCNTYDQPGATLLKIGAAYHGCNGVSAMNYWRSYLKFDVTGLVGKPIVSSTMQLWRTESPACHLRGNGKVYATRVGADWTPGRMTWANKPGGTADFVSTPCPTTGVLTPGVMTWPITNWVKAWTGGQPNRGVELSGPTESVDRYNAYSAVFHSAETTGTGATPPKLITQYILPPEIPTVTAESVDSMDGEHAIVRESSAKVGYRSTSVDGRNLDYYVSVVDSTAPLPTWTTGGGEVGKWSFTEGTEGTDSSGRNNPLIFVSGRYSWVNGKDGKALSLNGSVALPSFASTEDPVLRTDRSFSAAGWVRLEAGTGSVRLISQSGSLNSAFAVGYDAGSGKWNMEMYRDDTATGTVTEIRSPAAAQIDTWTHLTGVYDAVAKKIRLYVNGVQVAEDDHTSPPWQAGQTFELGGGKGGGYSYSSVKAAYDEIRAYDRALSPTEIQWMLNLTPPTNANLPSGQTASITYDVGNVDSFKISVRACINGATPLTCSESPYYRITTDAPYLPADTETGMADPARPILSGMVNRPSGGPVTAKYFLYDSTGAPVGSSPFGERTVNGGERASFQVPENAVQAGRTYTWQMQACALDVCTAKTAPVSVTIPGTPPDPPAETVDHLTLLKDSFVIKTAKVDPTACDGSPCTVTDSTVMRIGGSGTDKTVAVIGFKLGELPDGAGVSEGILKLGTPTCPAGTCPADAVITATPLKSQVTGETKGSDLAGDADTDTTPYSLPLSGPQVDIAGSEYQWLMLTSNKNEVMTFGDGGVAEQLSLALTYLPAGPPGKVLNLTAKGGDASVIVSWGVPEDNGSIAMLDGYDVQVVDGGTVVKTIEVKDSYALVSGLSNDVAYTMKVRARTAFGIGEWEAVTATTASVPPPASDTGEGATCRLEHPSAGVTAPAVTRSGASAYLDRVEHYYQAQDAVLEGGANTIWDAPGVFTNASNTGKLSLLNTLLIQQRESLRLMDVTRSQSAVRLSEPVIQSMPDGTVRVTTYVKRTWREEPVEGAATSVVASSALGTVEPSEFTLSVFVFDRCGDMSIIEVPIQVHEDSTDHSDPCSGFVNPDGTVEEVCGVSTSDSGTGPSYDVCTKVVEAKNSCSWYRAQPQVPQNPATRVPYKGMTIQVSGMHGWKPNPALRLKELKIAKHRVWAQAYFTKNFLKKYENYQFVKNMTITVTDKLCARVLSGTLNISYPPGYELTATEECEEKIVRGVKGDRVLHYPTQGDDNLEVTCAESLPNLCDIKEFQTGFIVEVHLPFKNPDYPDGRIKMTASSCWDLPNRYDPPIALGHSCPKYVYTLPPEL